MLRKVGFAGIWRIYKEQAKVFKDEYRRAIAFDIFATPTNLVS
jgi:hypothetical protein